MTAPRRLSDLSPDARRWPTSRALLDEAVSAELDGELDGLAHALGVDPDRFAQLLHDEPGYERRRSELERARSTARTAPVPAPLDELTRRRLVDAAVAGSGVRSGPRPGRSRARLTTVASLAAAVVVAGGVAWVLVDRDGGDQASDRASGAADQELADETLARDFGVVEDGAALRDRVARELGLAAPTAESGEGDDGGSEAAPDAAEPPSTASGSADRRQACVTALADSVDASAAPLLVASAVYEHRPAVVAAFETGGRVLVGVAALEDCRLLTVQSFASGG